jgi:CRISPR system Cascade subunit CasA
MAPSASDLVERQWLSARKGHSTDVFGLRELLLQAHDLTDIDVGIPPAASGLWRMLTVMAARITGLDVQDQGWEEWEDRRDAAIEEGSFGEKTVLQYFEKYRDRFDLFHPDRPFLQDPRLASECAKTSGLNKLVLSRPAGQNQVWLDHHHDSQTDPIDLSTAVLYLIAQLYYGPSGRCTARTVNGRNEANMTAGPLRGVISYHPVSDNLFTSLVISIPYLGRANAEDHALWETGELADPLGIPPVPAGVGGVLAGRFRHALLLTPSADEESVIDARLTWAFREPHGPVHDPYLVYQENKQGEQYARPADSARALWRDLDALLLADVGIDHRHRPEVLDAVHSLPDALLNDLRIRAYGFHQDGQTRDKQWFTATTPAVLGGLFGDMTAAGGASRAREAAERAERHLRGALRNAWTAINDPSNGDGLPARKDIPAGPWPAMAGAWYWPQAETRFWARVRSRNFTEVGEEFVHLAVSVYDQVTEQAAARPRSARAIERARGYIYRARNETPAKEKKA